MGRTVAPCQAYSCLPVPRGPFGGERDTVHYLSLAGPQLSPALTLAVPASVAALVSTERVQPTTAALQRQKAATAMLWTLRSQFQAAGSDHPSRHPIEHKRLPSAPLNGGHTPIVWRDMA